MADDKVVIGSNEDTPVKPGDLTKITSVINTDSAEDDSIATATIPRMKIKDGTTSNSADTSTINKGKIKAKLEEEKPKKKTTVKLKPVIVAETAEAAAIPPPPVASASSRIVAASAPAPAQATAVPRIASEDETVKIQKPRVGIASAAIASVKQTIEDETVKIHKPVSAVASTAVPGVKQTIKLRPSSTTPAPISGVDSSAGFTPPPPQPSPVAPKSPVLAGASEAKRTIRLVPKKSDATSGGEESSTPAKPSAPTIKLEGTTPPAPVESARAASTIKLPAEGEAVADSTAPPKRTLKLKSTRPPEATTVTPRPVPVAAPSPFPATPPPVPSVPPMPIPPPAVAAATDPEITSGVSEETVIPPEPVVEKKVQRETVPSAYGRQEPSIFFTIAACITFFAMAYFAWMLVGQYCNNYMDKKIPVPGLSGKIK